MGDLSASHRLWLFLSSRWLARALGFDDINGGATYFGNTSEIVKCAVRRDISEIPTPTPAQASPVLR
jgi:hypothetical protein